MKKEPMPHEKLEETEIKMIICELQAIAHHISRSYSNRFTTSDEELEKDLLTSLGDLSEKITKLKKHFCPEKFSVMKVTVNELAELMAYPKEKNERPS